MSSDSPPPLSTRPRIVRRAARDDAADASHRRWSWQPRAWARTMLEYFGLARPRRVEPVVGRAGLAAFLNTRASFVAQTSLYGYLRTRAGMRYPELFDDDPFVASINIAKWHMWLACLSDLAVYAGGLLLREGAATPAQVGALLPSLVGRILDETGVPGDAGPEFAEHARQVRARLALVDWGAVDDGEQAFSASPDALIRWAPVLDELKQLDEAIVRNSVRFRWQEVRRDLRACLDAPAVLGDAA
jgi:hypothetical protein